MMARKTLPVGSVIEDDALDLDQARMEMSANMLFPDLRSQIDGHEIELDAAESVAPKNGLVAGLD